MRYIKILKIFPENIVTSSMGSHFVTSIYIADTPENIRLFKNLDRIGEMTNQGRSPIIIAAINDYVERFMRTHQKQMLLTDTFISTGKNETEALGSDLVHTRSLVYTRSPPGELEREQRWKRLLAKHEERKKGLE